MSPLADYPEALRAAVEGLAPTTSVETVALLDAADRVLAESIAADRDLPPFNRAQMDGYAVRAADLAVDRPLPVVGSIRAGARWDLPVPPGACVAIATGAAVPPDLDLVVQHELTDRGNPVRLAVGDLAAGHAIHPRGADARAGDHLIGPGTALRPHHLGLAAMVGRERLAVFARPTVVLLTSGDEVVSPGDPVLPHQIRNSNQPMVTALLERIGARLVTSAHLPDEAEATRSAVAAALTEADVLITVGGVSAGEADHFPEALERAGVTFQTIGAAIQPGRPIRVGRQGSGAVVVTLPGNPVSALACACLFVWPIVRILGGADPQPPWQSLALAAPVRANARRRAFRPALRHPDGTCTVPTWAGSGDLAHTAATDGLVELPIQAEPVPAGRVLRFLPWP